MKETIIPVCLHHFECGNMVAKVRLQRSKGRHLCGIISFLPLYIGSGHQTHLLGLPSLGGNGLHPLIQLSSSVMNFFISLDSLRRLGFSLRLLFVLLSDFPHVFHYVLISWWP